MRNFVSRTSIFFSLTLVILIAFYTCLFYQKKEKYAIDKTNVIIGDSNTRWSIDDQILSNYQNFSTGGETYLFAYTKLKMLDKDNKIDTLLLTFNPHNVINNQWWNDDGKTPLMNRMPYFYDHFSWEDHWVLMRKTPKTYAKSFLKIGKPNLYRLLNWSQENKMYKFGSFQPVKGRNTQDTLFSGRREAHICDADVYYLKKIQRECEEKKIKLILIQTPKNKNNRRYQFYDSPAFYEFYDQNMDTVDFLDFSKLNIPEEYFWDIYHLNNIGADYFSRFIAGKKINNLLHTNYNRKHNN